MTSKESEILTYLADMPREIGSPDHVAVVIRAASIIEHEGELCPGIALTPDQAREFSDQLRDWADRAEEGVL